MSEEDYWGMHPEYYNAHKREWRDRVKRETYRFCDLMSVIVGSQTGKFKSFRPDDEEELSEEESQKLLAERFGSIEPSDE